MSIYSREKIEIANNSAIQQLQSESIDDSGAQTRPHSNWAEPAWNAHSAKGTLDLCVTFLHDRI